MIVCQFPRGNPLPGRKRGLPDRSWKRRGWPRDVCLILADTLFLTHLSWPIPLCWQLSWPLQQIGCTVNRHRCQKKCCQQSSTAGWDSIPRNELHFRSLWRSFEVDDLLKCALLLLSNYVLFSHPLSGIGKKQQRPDAKGSGGILGFPIQNL